MSYPGPVRRWDTLWADLEPAIGSERGGKSRPVIVISNDGYNNAFDVVTSLNDETCRAEIENRLLEHLDIAFGPDEQA